MSATIHDVAKLADCSIKTVSRVLNDEPHVRPVLYDRVKAAIIKSGYSPNPSARRLVKQRAGALGFLVYPRQVPLEPVVLATALDLARSEGYDLLLHVSTGQPSDREHLANLIRGHRLDGLVITPPGDTDPVLLELLALHPLPHVFIDPLDRETAHPYIAADDLQGVRDLTTHLLDAGHRRIAFLKGDPKLRANADRMAGYTQALAQRGIAFDPKYVADTAGTFEGGYNAARLYLSGGTRPTAFFAVNDAAALGVLFALQEMNVRVPREISVCGYGDLPESARVYPGLTTVRQPLSEMVALAFRLQVSILRGESPPTATLPPTEVIERGSTGPGPGT